VRSGYKAGALAYGLTLTDREFVVILDADFVPPPDFLRRTIPYLANDPQLGMVQTRWGHLNPFDNLLTRGQTLAVDGHFVVEQTGRNRAGLLMNFNGSGGVWRAQCIREAGGWSDMTLSEDLDLSYRAAYWLAFFVCLTWPFRASCRKWRPISSSRRASRGQHAVPGGVSRPGGAPLSLAQRLMATQHLCQYLPHPFTVCCCY
jgi:hypothetical protein